ncbi:MAG: sodium:proton antiporter [Phycisphaerales bacterium]|nr:sodium:proton antiporter [Phycisphaerales bacterium]
MAVCAASLLLTVAASWGLSSHGAAEVTCPPYWFAGTIPFVALLLVIALAGLVSGVAHWWESNLNRLAVALTMALATVGYLCWVEGLPSATSAAAHAATEYFPLMMLLASLFVISGGISLRAPIGGTPLVNASILTIGAFAASLLGTTGASMLLIRPLLDLNRGRVHVAHTVVFFIFIVSNTGGALLPIGDPPLFLGYLRGVPFFWTLSLWPAWLMVNGILVCIYLLLDRRQWKCESLSPISPESKSGLTIQIAGKINLVWLAGILASVVLLVPGSSIGGWTVPTLAREAAMATFTVLSLLTTPSGVHRHNKFNWAPLLEVAALFAGIFVCMQVPLRALAVIGPDLGLQSQAAFFWCTGALSSFLDNAPTYLVFFEVAQSVSSTADPSTQVAIGTGENLRYIDAALLRAVSMGAVFMGASTYIGNGPNFMVRSMAEQAGVRMPSFLGYMLWAACVLIPLFALVTLLFM